MSPYVGDLMRAAQSLTGRVVENRRRRRNMRIIEGLSENILKDIGYARDSFGGMHHVIGD